MTINTINIIINLKYLAAYNIIFIVFDLGWIKSQFKKKYSFAYH